VTGGPDSYDVVVLAGGGGRRLGGVDKPGLEVGGSTLLDRVLAVVGDAGTVVVVGPERETSRPVVWAREDPPGGGPAAALAAGLRHVSAPTVVVLAADLPFLDAATVRVLREAAEGADGAVLVDGEGRDQVLTSAWTTARLRERATGDLHGKPLRALLRGLDPVRLAAPDPRAVADVDTPEDLARARRQAGQA
jgi:molybdopterin-guanine dinucleotide biosynthesis protein A